jgi:hypothetical protein
MITLKNRFLHEPPVAVGVLLAVGLLFLKVTTGGAITPQDLSEISAPILAGLAARPLVSPSRPPQRPETS